MRILMVNKFHYIVGGSETYYFALKRLLEENGHTVIEFSMHDERNIPSDYVSYFVRNVDYNGEMSLMNKIKVASSIIYSTEAKKKFEELVINTKPDIVHLHIFQHQISPSILDVIRKYNIPTVYTAHELKMICPNYRMLNHGKVCEECKGEHYWHCLKNRCVKDSLSKSLVSTIESYVHKVRKSYDVIQKIITPSAFYRTKFIEFGVNADRVVHIPNFLDRECPAVNKRDDRNKYILYLGRLSEEKGIMTLVKAAGKTGYPTYIAGSGALRQQIEDIIHSQNIDNIKMLGFISGQELIDYVGNAKAVVLPSEWYENGPYSAIEALQLGRPIIGADIGGIPELVDGNGFLYDSGNIEELVQAIRKLYSMSEEEYLTLEENSKKLFKKNFTGQGHYEKLMRVYEEAVFNKAKR